jgi:hypothetical protein
MHANYQYTGSGGREASWHYSVDKNEIWQSFDDSRECWHAGDGSNGPGNYTSIGIEICVNDRVGFPAACDKTAWLTAELLRKHKLTVDKVKQHYDWSKKNCPAELRSGTWGFTWNDFIALVKDYLKTDIYMDSDDIPIISPATASYQQAETWARGMGATDTFVSLARKYWDYASIHGNVNPVIAYCQAALETGYGKFKGVIDESFNNPCGMKTTTGGSDTDPNAHQRFASWENGVKAHLEHLALYAGAPGYPLKNGYDPRHFPYLFGTGATLKTMAVRWCPSSPNYAVQIRTMMDRVAGTKAETTTVKPTPTPEQIIYELSKKVTIASPEYWIGVLKGNTIINYDYLNTLLARLAGFEVEKDISRIQRA